MLPKDAHWLGADTYLAEIGEDGKFVFDGPYPRIIALQYTVDALARGERVVASTAPRNEAMVDLFFILLGGKENNQR